MHLEMVYSLKQFTFVVHTCYHAKHVYSLFQRKRK